MNTIPYRIYSVGNFFPHSGMERLLTHEYLFIDFNTFRNQYLENGVLQVRR